LYKVGFLSAACACSSILDKAFDKLGVPLENRETIFRFDDTNPEAESKEFITNIAEDVEWMGWKPTKTT